MNMNLSRSWEN
jgi:Stage IV sporulation protein A (spore_IV_A)